MTPKIGLQSVSFGNWERLATTLVSLTVCVFAVCLWAAWPTPVAQAATGQSTSRTDTVIRQQATTVEAGERMADVLVIGHNATVAGRVGELLVVVDGDVHLTSSARVGTVVDLGGSVQRDPGARVNALYRIALHTPFWGGALFGGVFSLLLWAGMLAFSVSLVVLSVLVTFAMRRQLHAALAEVERSVRRAGAVGVLVTVAVSALAALCAVTAVALPVAGFVLAVYLAAGVVGFTIISQWLGKLALRYAPIDRPPWLRALVGSVLAVAFINIPYVGLMLFVLLWLAGIGAVTAWLWQLRQARGSKYGQSR